MATEYTIDSTDKKILDVLQENGRITNLHLSNLIGLSPAPTLERVRKLEKAKVLVSYHAEVDATKLGYGLNVTIQVTLARQIENAMQKFSSAIQQIDEVIECVQVTGDYDYLLRVVVKDVRGLDQLINEKLSTIEVIGQLKTSVILATIKNSKKIPID